MLVLGINTVADVCEATLLDGAAVHRIAEPMTQGHDARLAPVVEAVMRKAGRAFSDLDRIGVVVGPGSFTGIRVGVAFARGLALALDIPVGGFTTLEAMDYAPFGELPPMGRLLTILPAKRRPPDRTWWAQVIYQGRGFAPPVEIRAEELAVMAVNEADFVCGVIDDAPAVTRSTVAAIPTAEQAARLAASIHGDRYPPARPVYVREPDATPMARS